jgi:D-alanyl-D-alanine dipeptidase
VEQYPNGQIPVAALCPIWGAAGYLRADAAFAYDRMSHAYADRFGGPICLTDSYRPYAVQVDLFARKPGLAAVPGTSNHGWGTAVDLCGGIEDFGTVQHEWMFVNAPLYG